MCDPTHPYACINPDHLVLVTQQVNIDHNRCAYGGPATCPHRPQCYWMNRVSGHPV